MSDIEVNLSLRGPTKLETKRSHQVREIEKLFVTHLPVDWGPQTRCPSAPPDSAG